MAEPMFGGVPVEEEQTPMFEGEPVEVETEEALSEATPKKEYEAFSTEAPLHPAQLVPTMASGAVEGAKAVGRGLHNGVREAVLGVASVGESTGRWLGELIGTRSPDEPPEEGVKKLYEQWPRMEGSPDDNFAIEALEGVGEAIPGLYVGGGVAGAILPKAVTTIGKVARMIGVGFGAEAGAAATMNPDQNKLLTGPEGFMKWGFDEKGESFNQELWEKKANLLLDGMIVSGALAPVGGVANKFGQFLFGIDGLFAVANRLGDKSSQEGKVFRTLIDIVADVGPDDTPKQVAQKRKQIVDLIRENSEVFQKFRNSTDQEVADVASKADFQNDIITTVINSLDPKTQGDQIARLESIRASAAAGGGAPQMRQADMKPAMAVDEALGSGLKNRGELAKLPTAAKEGTDVAAQPIRDVQEQIAGTNFDINLVEDELQEAMESDKTFGPLLKKISKDVDIDFSAPARNAADTMSQRLLRANDIMSQIKNDKYEAFFQEIPGAKLDQGRLTADLKEVGQNLDKNILKKIKAAKGDFKKIYDIVNTDIADEISRLSKGFEKGDYSQMKALQKFQRSVQEDQLDFIKAAHPDAAPLIDEAKRYMKEDFSIWRKYPVLEELDHIAKDRINVADEMVPQEARNRLTQTLENPKQDIEQGVVTKVLGSEEAGKSKDLAKEYVGGKLIEELQPLANKSGKLTAEDFSKVPNILNKHQALLKEDPAGQQEIKDFLTKLRDGTITIENLQDNLKTLTKSLDESNKVFDANYKDFFDGTGPSRTLKENVYKGFEKMFKEQDMSKLNKFLEAAEKNPEAKEGLQAAYFQYLRKALQDSKTDLKIKELSVPELDKYLSKESSMGKISEKVLGKEWSDLLDNMFQTALDRYSGKAIKGPDEISRTGVRERGAQAVNGMITIAFGILNPTAAKLRTVTGHMMKANDPTNQVTRIIDAILSNPKDFLRIAEKHMKSSSPHLSEMDKAAIRRAFRKGGLYAFTDDNENPADFETDENLSESSEAQDGGLNTEGKGPLELTITKPNSVIDTEENLK